MVGIIQDAGGVGFLQYPTGGGDGEDHALVLKIFFHGFPGQLHSKLKPLNQTIPIQCVLRGLLVAVDGLLQLCTPYESGNYRRLVTGLLFGYGLTVLLLLSLGWTYRWGFAFGLRLLGR